MNFHYCACPKMTEKIKQIWIWQMKLSLRPLVWKKPNHIQLSHLYISVRCWHRKGRIILIGKFNSFLRMFDCVRNSIYCYLERLNYIYRTDANFRNVPAINGNCILRCILCNRYVGWIIVFGSFVAVFTAIMMQLPAHFCIEMTGMEIPYHQAHKSLMVLTLVYSILALVTPPLMHLLRVSELKITNHIVN